jgi:hypothetical protein
MRCPDCNKFVAFDEMRCDEVEFSLDEESGQVTVSGTVYLPCAECGTDLKSLSVDGEVDMAERFEAAPESYAPEGRREDTAWVEKNVEVSYVWEGSEPEASATERTQNTTRRFNKKTKQWVETPIKNPRYMKTFRGVEAEGTVKRTVRVRVEKDERNNAANADGSPGEWDVHEDEAEFEFEYEEQASAFEECC